MGLSLPFIQCGAGPGLVVGGPRPVLDAAHIAARYRAERRDGGQPSGHTTGLAFGGLVRRLEADFGAPCESERDTQDSSEYGRVRMPAEATVCGERIVVCVSKFG